MDRLGIILHNTDETKTNLLTEGKKSAEGLHARPMNARRPVIIMS